MSVYGVICLKLSCIGQGTVNGDCFFLRIDQPDQRDSTFQEFTDLVSDMPHVVGWREHLDGKVGQGFQKLFGRLTLREPFRYGRKSHRVTGGCR